MLEITNVKVYDLEESIVAARNAMRTEPAKITELEINESFDRCVKLVKASRNSDVHCHDNFLTGIGVSFDIKYPQYWTPEFQRYHFAQIVTSSSKMHRLLKMDIDKACNKYVSLETVTKMKRYISEYNLILNTPDEDFGTVGWKFNYRDGASEIVLNKDTALYRQWMIVLSNCPLGLELFMRVSTNYKQLQTIYAQRKNHKLKEDWGPFCDMIRNLPYAKDFLLND